MKYYGIKNILIMEKKLMNYALFGIFALMCIVFAGCSEDGDDSNLAADISQVKKDLEQTRANLVAVQASLSIEIQGVKDKAAEQAIEQSIAAIDKLLKAKDDEGNPIKFEDVAPVLGQLIVLSRQLGSVGTLEDATRTEDILLTKASPEQQTWATVLIGYHTRIAELEFQAAALGLVKKEDDKYTISNGLLNDIWVEINALKKVVPGNSNGGGNINYEDIVKALSADDDFIETIIERINKEDAGLVTLEAKINTLVTGISYVKTLGSKAAKISTNLVFNKATPLVNSTFGQGKTGAISFDTTQINEGTVVDFVYVRVSPTNAKLSKDNIVLIDSKEQTKIGEYVKVYSVQPYTGNAITKADASAGGIYKITFTLGSNYNPHLLGMITTSDQLPVASSANNINENDIAFAIAVENKTSEGTRYITTDFETGIAVTSPPPSVYNTDYFTVNSKPLKDLYNQFSVGSGVKELAWASTNSSNNVNPFDQTSVKVDVSDSRRDTDKKEVLGLTLGEGFSIEVINTDILAYYIDFDTNGASNENLSLWKGASFTGLDRVYGSGEKATITTKDLSLTAKRVGFRVYAVNYNGTLVDPDGKAFYVSYRTAVLEGFAVNFVVNITDRLTDAKAKNYASDRATIEFPKDVNIFNVSGYTLTIGNINYTHQDQTSGGNGLTVGGGSSSGKDEYLVRYASEKEDDLAFEWKDTKYLALRNLDLTKLESSDVKQYTGALKLLDKEGYPLAEFIVTLAKKFPNGFPVDGLKLRPGIPTGSNKLTVNNLKAGVNVYTFLADIDDSTIKGVDPKIISNLTVSFSYKDPDAVGGVKYVTLSDKKINDTWLIPQAAMRQDLNITIGYNYGNVSYTEKEVVPPYIVPSTMSYTLFLKSTLDDVTYSWGADKTWEKKVIYNRMARTIYTEDKSDLYLSDMAAKQGTGQYAALVVVDGSFYTRISNVILRLVDKNNNYAEISNKQALSGMGAIEFSSINEIHLAGGSISYNGNVIDAFTPVKAILYIDVIDKNQTGNVWPREKIAEFSIDCD
jgi:hypothetical protein